MLMGIIAVLLVLFFILLVIVVFRSQKTEDNEKIKPTEDAKTAEIHSTEIETAIPWQEINHTIKKSRQPELDISAEVPPRYKKTRYFFTYQERIFYQLLSQSVGGKYVIFAQVRMADVLYLANEPINRKIYNNNIRCRHFDYVLCEPQKYKPVLAIELDDSSHQKYDRKASDKFKNAACQSARLALLRIKLPYSYSPLELFELVENKISGEK